MISRNLFGGRSTREDICFFCFDKQQKMEEVTKRHLPPELWTCVLRVLQSQADLLAFMLISKSCRELVFSQPTLLKPLCVLHKRSWKNIEGAARVFKKHGSNIKMLDLAAASIGDEENLSRLFSSFPSLKNFSIAAGKVPL